MPPCGCGSEMLRAALLICHDRHPSKPGFLVSRLAEVVGYRICVVVAQSFNACVDGSGCVLSCIHCLLCLK